MPTVHRLSNARICMYADDHAPPHFHLKGPDWECMIDIDTLQIIEGDAVKRDYLDAISWARSNRDTLLSEWRRLNERE